MGWHRNREGNGEFRDDEMSLGIYHGVCWWDEEWADDGQVMKQLKCHGLLLHNPHLRQKPSTIFDNSSSTNVVVFTVLETQRLWQRKRRRRKSRSREARGPSSEFKSRLFAPCSLSCSNSRPLHNKNFAKSLKILLKFVFFTFSTSSSICAPRFSL